MKHPNQRVAVFVDIQNLYYSSRVLFNKKVDYEGVLDGAVSGRKLIRAIGYGIATEEAHEDEFFDALEEIGYEIKTKDLQIFSGGQKKGDWDVGIAVDAIKIAPKVDVIVLVSGDGDYIPLVEYLKSTSGCRVEGMAFGESTSIRLIESLNDFINLSEDKEKYTISQKKSNKISRGTDKNIKKNVQSKKISNTEKKSTVTTNTKNNTIVNSEKKAEKKVQKQDDKFVQEVKSEKYITLSGKKSNNTLNKIDTSSENKVNLNKENSKKQNKTLSEVDNKLQDSKKVKKVIKAETKEDFKEAKKPKTKSSTKDVKTSKLKNNSKKLTKSKTVKLDKNEEIAKK